MNIQKQNTIDKYGRIIKKNCLTHNQSYKWLSGTSVNSRVITEELGGPYSTSMDPCTTPPEVPSLLLNASQAMNSPKTLLQRSTTKTSDLDENQGKHCNDIPLDHMPTADKLAALSFCGPPVELPAIMEEKSTLEWQSKSPASGQPY